MIDRLLRVQRKGRRAVRDAEGVGPRPAGCVGGCVCSVTMIFHRAVHGSRPFQAHIEGVSSAQAPVVELILGLRGKERCCAGYTQWC